MEKKSISIALLLLISILTLFSDHAVADQTSEAFLPEKAFTFEPVLEGESVSHDFILKNKGTAPLEILKIESG